MTITQSNKTPAIFLDRDGVIIYTKVYDAKPYAIHSISELKVLPGIELLMNYYRNLGYKIVVVTNQPDVGNGFNKQKSVEDMHQLLLKLLPIDLIKVCYHNQSYGCNCRKPAIGMFLQAAQELNIDLTRSLMIGDRYTDIVAGKKAGCYFTILIDYMYNEPVQAIPDLIVSSIIELFEQITGVKNYQ